MRKRETPTPTARYDQTRTPPPASARAPRWKRQSLSKRACSGAAAPDRTCRQMPPDSGKTAFPEKPRVRGLGDDRRVRPVGRPAVAVDRRSCCGHSHRKSLLVKAYGHPRARRLTGPAPQHARLTGGPTSCTATATVIETVSKKLQESWSLRPASWVLQRQQARRRANAQQTNLVGSRSGGCWSARW